MLSFKSRHFPKEVILQCVRWYCTYALSYRNIEEILAEKGVEADHSTLNRWVVFYAQKLEKEFHKKKKRPGDRWRLDERDTKAALRYLTQAIKRNGKPSLVNIDKSGANKAAVTQYNTDNSQRVVVRQCKYLNNIIEQDHRRIKRITRLMLGFKNFNSAQSTLAGIEVVAMIKKGQVKKNISRQLSCADQFYALAA
ncbi:MAG: IS6 family transposase [Alteromonadaceae bacterium]|nr:MAG: IS6 family transposase [Alteromonadaceae bacterium]